MFFVLTYFGRKYSIVYCLLFRSFVSYTRGHTRGCYNGSCFGKGDIVDEVQFELSMFAAA